MEKVVEGKAFVDGVFQDCCIGVDNGKIVKIKKILKGDEHLNFRNKLILPAGIDIHVHFREPGMTHKEDWYTGSSAAVFGGVSCVFDMPNTNPNTATVAALKEKVGIAKEKSVVDFGVYAGLTDNNLSEIQKLSNFCNGFKVYLGSSTNTLLFNLENLPKLFGYAEKTGLPILFHAEDEKCLTKYKRTEDNIIDHLKARPDICEISAVEKVLNSLENHDVNIHFCHISTVEALDLIKNKKKHNVTCGVTPHHSLLSADKKFSFQSFYKVNPPLRKTFVKESLYNNLENGFINILESDHAPHTLEEKERSFEEAPCGVPGVETMYPLFLYLAKREKISWRRLFYSLCEKPAELLKIQKGRIVEGFDADFVVVDLKDECKIRSDMLHSRCGWTPFEDWKALFPSDIFIRGEQVVEDCDLMVKKGFGNKI